MLTFFKVNDPYRILVIFFILIIIRLPFMINGPFLTVPELKWMVIGEKVAADHLMYVGIWDYLAPLSSLIYALIHLLFGKSQITYFILSAFLVAYQSFVFNDFLLRNKVYNENTYVPALIYALIASCFVDFLTLSPALMSLTWVVLGLSNLFDRIESKSRDERILNTGLFLGISILFYFPSIIFIVVVLVAYMLFTSLLIRRYVLMMFGILLPTILTATYFFWQGYMYDFFNKFFGSYFSLRDAPLVNYQTLLGIALIPALFLVLSLLKLLGYSRYTSYQARLQYLMFLILIGAWITIYVSLELAPYHLLLFLPPVAFFVTHYFLLIRKTFFAELLFLFFMVLIFIGNYGTLNGKWGLQNYIDLDNLMVKSTPYDSISRGKSVVILGNNPEILKQSTIATPYLNWNLSKQKLQNWQFYENLVAVHTHFREDTPEVVIDLQNLFPQLQQHIDYLGKSYIQGEQENVFLLKNGETTINSGN